MAVEFFFVPMIGTGTRPDPYRGKYSRDPAVIQRGQIRYSRDTTTLLMLNATQVYLDFIAAQPDAYRICTLAEITDNIGGPGMNAIRDWLEPLGIPANWVAASDSFQEVLRGVVGMFLFAQRHEGLNGSGFFTDLEDAGFGLDTQWQNLSQAFRDTIQATIDDHGWLDQPANTDQIRKLLKDFSEKFEGLPFYLCSVEI